MPFDIKTLNKKFVATVALWINDLIDVIFPNVCTVCHRRLVKGENVICLHCLSDLPRTNLHKYRPNKIHERLMAIGMPVEKATSLFYYYRDSPYARLIHDTKYRNRPTVGRTLAMMHTQELKGTDFFDSIDCIVPVPLHLLKHIKRGYNQAEEIARGINSVTSLPIINALSASYHKTQTRKDSHQRLLNVKGVYNVAEVDAIQGKHILLIDDVITTGATLLSCMQAIRQASPSTRISVYSLSITQLG